MLDGTARVTDATPLSGVPSLPAFTTLAVGQDIQQNNKLYNGTLAHLAVRSGTTATPDPRIVEHYHTGADGFV